MSLINKNVAAAFGYAVFGRATLAVDFDSQNIPSELYDGAKNLGLISRPEGIVSKRYPFSVEQPGTPEQQAVWDIFLKACACFAKQPETGGAVPPAIGPRGRDWWYDNDKETPPIYFNYFMKETLTLLHQGVTPDWCKTAITMDTTVLSEQPDRNVSDWDWIDLKLYDYPATYIAWRIWLKMPGEGKRRLWIYIANTSGEPPPMLEISIHDQSATEFDTSTLTWNTQPELGPVIKVENLPAPFTGWWPFDAEEATRICLKYTDDGHESRNIEHWLVAYSSSNPDTTRRPWYEIID